MRDLRADPQGNPFRGRDWEERQTLIAAKKAP
jgi:hypothetical protein